MRLSSVGKRAFEFQVLSVCNKACFVISDVVLIYTCVCKCVLKHSLQEGECLLVTDVVHIYACVCTFVLRHKPWIHC